MKSSITPLFLVLLVSSTIQAQRFPSSRPTYQFTPSAQPTNGLARLDYPKNFVTGGLALLLAVVILLVYFLYGFIRQIGFFRFTRMTRPCSMVFMQAFERMIRRIEQKKLTARDNASDIEPSPARAAWFLFGATIGIAIAGPVLFVYLSIGIFFQAMLIYRTFPLNTDPLSTNSNFLEFIRQWWSIVIRYIVPINNNYLGKPYSPIPYDTTVIYAPMLIAFDWLVNLKIDFGMALKGVICQGAYLAPLELLLDAVIVLILMVVIEGIQYVVLAYSPSHSQSHMITPTYTILPSHPTSNIPSHPHSHLHSITHPPLSLVFKGDYCMLLGPVTFHPHPCSPPPLSLTLSFTHSHVIAGDYCMLLGPVMNGTYDKYMERMYRDKVNN